MSSDPSSESVYAPPGTEVVGGASDAPLIDPLHLAGWFFLTHAGAQGVHWFLLLLFGLRLSGSWLLLLAVKGGLGWALLRLGRNAVWGARLFLLYELLAPLMQAAFFLGLGQASGALIVLPFQLLWPLVQVLPSALLLVGTPGPKRRKTALMLFGLSLVLMVVGTASMIYIFRYGP